MSDSFQESNEDQKQVFFILIVLLSLKRMTLQERYISADSKTLKIQESELWLIRWVMTWVGTRQESSSRLTNCCSQVSCITALAFNWWHKVMCSCLHSGFSLENIGYMSHLSKRIIEKLMIIIGHRVYLKQAQAQIESCFASLKKWFYVSLKYIYGWYWLGGSKLSWA